MFSLEVDELEDGSVCVLASGEVDLASAPALVDAVVAQDRPVVLDMAGVTFMDSTGIHALARMVDAAGDLTIRSELQPQVRKVLEVSGMLGILPFAAAVPAPEER